MILYFADRKMNIIGTAFTNKSEGYICYNDVETSEIDTGTITFTANIAYPAGKREEALQRVKSGNYLFVADDDGNATFYTIIESESTTLDRSIYIYAEDIGLDLLNNLSEPLDPIAPRNLRGYLEPFIYGTDFEEGDWDDPYFEDIQDNPELLLTLSEQTSKERLQNICEAFDVEPYVTFKIEGMRVTHKYLNVKQKRGANNHVQLVIGREVSDIRVSQTVANLATALKPHGARPEGSTGVMTYKEPLTSGGYRQFYMWLKFISYDEAGNVILGDSTSGSKFILNSRIDQFDPVESDDLGDYSINRYNHDSVFIVKPQQAGHLEFKDEPTDDNRYTWVRFSPNEDGSNMTWQFTYGTSKYIGIADGQDSSTPSSNPEDYDWTEITYATAEKQIVIISGTGAGVLTEGNNVTSNVWIKYSANPDGSSMSDSPSATTAYVGLCYGRGTTESSSASDYEWVELETATSDGLFVETKGAVNRGLRYTNKNGETKYIHYRFAGDEFGNDISYEVNGSYIGIKLDNTYPTPMSMDPDDYVWSPVSGVQIDAIDLYGYEYTEQDEDGNDDIFIEEGIVKSYKALRDWGRYVTDNTASTHIVRAFSYDTEDRHTLLEETVKELKKVREPSVSYEVSLIYLPEDLSLGDTVYVTDPEGGLYLEARLLKLKKEYCNKQITATFGDYKVVENDLADELEKLRAKVEKQLENLTTYTWIVYADDPSGLGISVNPDGKRWMGIASNKLTKTPDLTNPFLYSWSKIAVKEETFTTYYYGSSTSAAIVPTNWSEVYFEPDASNPYLWSKGTKHFNDGTTEYIPPHIIGVFGVGVSSIVTYYAVNNNSSQAPTSGWVTTPIPVITASTPYLWSYEVINYTDGTSVTGDKKIVGTYGRDGTIIVSDDNWYIVTNSDTVPSKSASGWQKNPQTIPAITSNARYLWTYEIVAYSDNTTKETPIHLIGVYGEQGIQGPQGPQGNPGQDGADGQDGKYVVKQVPQYYLSTSSQEPIGGLGWSDEPQAFVSGRFYFVRTHTFYSDNTTVYGDPVLDMALTSSNQNAINAQTTADGKGTIFYQTTAPSATGRNSNDIWFDTDDGNAMYRFNESTSTWDKVALGDGALASLSASKLLAGTIDASVITVSNINAGNITTGVFNANLITAGILQGPNDSFSLNLQTGEVSLSNYASITYADNKAAAAVDNSVEAVFKHENYTNLSSSVEGLSNTVGQINSVTTALGNRTTTLESTVEQNASSVALHFQQTDAQVSNNSSTVSKVEQNFIFGTTGLVVTGNSETQMISKFSNTSLDFYTGATVEDDTARITHGTRVAWINGQEGVGGIALSIGDATTNTKRWNIRTNTDGTHLTFTRFTS